MPAKKRAAPSREQLRAVSEGLTRFVKDNVRDPERALRDMKSIRNDEPPPPQPVTASDLLRAPGPHDRNAEFNGAQHFPSDVRRYSRAASPAPAGSSPFEITDPALLPPARPQRPWAKIASGPGTLSGATSRAKVDDPNTPVAKQPQSWGAVADSVAAQRPGSDSGWSQSTVGNGDGGPELSTADDVAGLHSRFDELAGSIGSMQGGGGQGNRNMQQSHQQLSDPRAATSAHFQQRQTSFNGIAPPNTTNAMSAGHAEASFNGTFGSGVGSSQGTWNVSKWRQPQQV